MRPKENLLWRFLKYFYFCGFVTYADGHAIRSPFSSSFSAFLASAAGFLFWNFLLTIIALFVLDFLFRKLEEAVAPAPPPPPFPAMEKFRIARELEELETRRAQAAEQRRRESILMEQRRKEELRREKEAEEQQQAERLKRSSGSALLDSLDEF